MSDYKKGYSTCHTLSILMDKWTKALADNLFEKATYFRVSFKSV